MSKYTWNDVKEAYINESLIRNVRWAAQAEPALGSDVPDPVLDPQRPQRTFLHNQVSFRLLIYHVYFLERIARPAGKSLAQVAADYDSRLGRASGEQKAQFQALVKDVIESVVSFDQLFSRVGLAVPSQPELVRRLRACVTASLHRGYHFVGGNGTPDKTFNWSPRKKDAGGKNERRAGSAKHGAGLTPSRQSLTRSTPSSPVATPPLASPAPSPPPPPAVNAWAARALQRQLSMSSAEQPSAP